MEAVRYIKFIGFEENKIELKKKLIKKLKQIFCDGYCQYIATPNKKSFIVSFYYQLMIKI